MCDYCSQSLNYVCNSEPRWFRIGQFLKTFLFFCQYAMIDLWQTAVRVSQPMFLFINKSKCRFLETYEEDCMSLPTTFSLFFGWQPPLIAASQSTPENDRLVLLVFLKNKSIIYPFYNYSMWLGFDIGPIQLVSIFNQQLSSDDVTNLLNHFRVSSKFPLIQLHPFITYH